MRKSFILYFDSLSILDELSDELTGKLFKKIKAYNLGEEYMSGNQIVDLLFIQFRNQFDRDLEKYNSICERNKENGVKGGRPKENIETRDNPNNPVGFLGTQSNPNNLDSDSDSVNESESDNVNENVNKTDNKTVNKNKEYIEAIYTHWQNYKQADINWKTNRGLSEDIENILNKILKKYTTDDIEIAIANYKKEIKSRKDKDGYFIHRFSLQEFFTNRKGFMKFYNLI